MKIGFIGQGFIGKAYADDFEKRGYEVVRYSKEEPYIKNKDDIRDCDIVLIAVPTPTTPSGSDESIVRDVVGLVGERKIALIKSTILPGVTESIQEQYPKVFVLHSPEFLRERTAAQDAAKPTRNIIGMSTDSKEHRECAESVLEVMPKADYELICSSRESELIKYISNAFLYTKVVYANMMHDLAENIGADWDVIKDGVTNDPRIGKSHFDPVHSSGHVEHLGRGAGGHCFIKDFAALADFFDDETDDELGSEVLRSLEKKNNELLRSTNKDMDLLDETYGSQ